MCNRQNHLENAIDRAFPSGKIHSWHLATIWEQIELDADEEMQQCEETHN